MLKDLLLLLNNTIISPKRFLKFADSRKVRIFVVFFIVLDLRLTKGWSKALLLFLWSNVRSTSAVRFRYPIQNHREESVQCIPLRDCVT